MRFSLSHKKKHFGTFHLINPQIENWGHFCGGFFLESLNICDSNTPYCISRIIRPQHIYTLHRNHILKSLTRKELNFTPFRPLGPYNANDQKWWSLVMFHTTSKCPQMLSKVSGDVSRSYRRFFESLNVFEANVDIIFGKNIYHQIEVQPSKPIIMNYGLDPRHGGIWSYQLWYPYSIQIQLDFSIDPIEKEENSWELGLMIAWGLGDWK